MYDDLYKDMYDIEDNENWYSIIPLAFLVSIVPLIVYGKMMVFTGDYYKYWQGIKSGMDFFCYYKSLWILVSTVIAAVVFGIMLFSKNIKIRKTKIYIPIVIYSVFVMLSTVFSDFSQIAVWGFVERYEGMIVLLCYMTILFVSINLASNKSSIKVILIALICSAVIIGVIGILQYFGHDFYKSLTGKRLMLPKQYQSLAAKVKFQFGDKIIYSSLYHYNYVGSYMAMLFPLTFTMFLLIKNKFYKILMAVVTIIMFLNLILCHSRAGIIGGGVAIIVLVIMMRKFFVRKWKMTIGAGLIAVVALVGFNVYSKGALANRIGSLFSDAQDLASSKGTSEEAFKNITLQNDTVNIIFSNETLKIKNISDNIVFQDSSDKELKTNINKSNGEITFLDNSYKDYKIIKIDNSTTTDKKYNLEVHKNNLKMRFLLYNGKFDFVNYKGEVVELKPVEKWGFEGKEKLGSARGYIWSRSIPLLKHTLILGYGPDTFAAVFPQGDYIGKLIAYDTDNMLVDKAHNLYLENAINIGMLGLVAFLAILIMYLGSSIKLYIKREFDDFYSVVGLAIFTAICGYLGAGFFNDSVVSVAPVFWVMLGIGISINYKLKDNNNKVEKV
ncbi:O-antigen ligase family protein [Clostridium magnum]|uniref:O-antigen ligase n=1 Tax=Clostridium magnum DSM 2767 TaxID=1121326 RepID=A0A161WTK7_9CLOT|nr:O-antigen ligase family protein [Clostridium magnum]KZL90188.1 O-antigen ligase [Clostridium magnum DSM 2767]SHH63813.1 O-Antigen ligase [Clostridium magnum DSM 2767]